MKREGLSVSESSALTDEVRNLATTRDNIFATETAKTSKQGKGWIVWSLSIPLLPLFLIS